MAAALVPLLLFAVFQVGYTAREQRRTVEASALSVADKLILAADVETVRYAALLDALATSRALRESNWQRLGQRFGEFQALNPDLRGLAVGDTGGVQVAAMARRSCARCRLRAGRLPASRCLPVMYGLVTACA